jgi:hypothetical protein
MSAMDATPTRDAEGGSDATEAVDVGLAPDADAPDAGFFADAAPPDMGIAPDAAPPDMGFAPDAAVDGGTSGAFSITNHRLGSVAPANAEMVAMRVGGGAWQVLSGTAGVYNGPPVAPNDAFDLVITCARGSHAETRIYQATGAELPSVVNSCSIPADLTLATLAIQYTDVPAGNCASAWGSIGGFGCSINVNLQDRKSVV